MGNLSRMKIDTFHDEFHGLHLRLFRQVILPLSLDRRTGRLTMLENPFPTPKFDYGLPI